MYVCAHGDRQKLPRKCTWFSFDTDSFAFVPNRWCLVCPSVSRPDDRFQSKWLRAHWKWTHPRNIKAVAGNLFIWNKMHSPLCLVSQNLLPTVI